MLLAQIVLQPLALESITLSGVLLATMGSLFLAYDLLGRENLIVIAFALQAVQPAIDILNQIK